jgi:hypothetical protein
MTPRFPRSGPFSGDASDRQAAEAGGGADLPGTPTGLLAAVVGRRFPDGGGIVEAGARHYRRRETGVPRLRPTRLAYLTGRLTLVPGAGPSGSRLAPNELCDRAGAS